MDSIELENFRQQIGWSKKELADRLDITANTVYNYLNNKTSIPGPVCKLIQVWREKFNLKEE